MLGRGLGALRGVAVMGYLSVLSLGATFPLAALERRMRAGVPYVQDELYSAVVVTTVSLIDWKICQSSSIRHTEGTHTPYRHHRFSGTERIGVGCKSGLRTLRSRIYRLREP